MTPKDIEKIQDEALHIWSLHNIYQALDYAITTAYNAGREEEREEILKLTVLQEEEIYPHDDQGEQHKKCVYNIVIRGVKLAITANAALAYSSNK